MRAAHLSVFGEVTFRHLDLVLLLRAVPVLRVEATEALSFFPEVSVQLRLDLLDTTLRQKKHEMNQD